MISFYLNPPPPSKSKLQFFGIYTNFFSTFGKKCTFPFEKPKTLREGLKKTKKNCEKLHICFWPTHPSPNNVKKQKNMLFFGLFSSFGTKIFLENFLPWKFLNLHIYGQIFLIVGFLGWIFLLWILFTPKCNSENQQSTIWSGLQSAKLAV